MSVFSYLNISKSVTKEEWEKAYIESLRLVEAFPLGELARREYFGEQLWVAVKIREKERETWDGKKWTGWHTIGDLDTLKLEEDFSLKCDLVADREPETHVDALMPAFAAYGILDWNDPRCQHTYELWGNKTQSEPYHMYLLAIGCLICTILNEKAAIYGDITVRQLESAVRLANKYSKIPVELPAQCDIKRFVGRLKKMYLKPEEEIIFSAARLFCMPEKQN